MHSVKPRNISTPGNFSFFYPFEPRSLFWLKMPSNPVFIFILLKKTCQKRFLNILRNQNIEQNSLNSFRFQRQKTKRQPWKHNPPPSCRHYSSSILSALWFPSPPSVSCRLLCDVVIIEDVAPVFNTGWWSLPLSVCANLSQPGHRL